MRRKYPYFVEKLKTMEYDFSEFQMDLQGFISRLRPIAKYNEEVENRIKNSLDSLTAEETASDEETWRFDAIEKLDGLIDGLMAHLEELKSLPYKYMPDDNGEYNIKDI